MALSKLLLLFLFSLAEARTELEPETLFIRGTRRSVLAALDCTAACGTRCSQSSRPNLCNRACGTCCQRCSCVPPGTAGNYDSCPCYAAMTTHGGLRKCP